MSDFDFRKIFKSRTFKRLVGTVIFCCFFAIILNLEAVNLFFANNHHLFGVFTPLAVAFVGFAQYKLATDKADSDEKKLIRKNWKKIEKIIFHDIAVLNNFVPDKFITKTDKDCNLNSPFNEVVTKFFSLKNELEMLKVDEELKNLSHQTYLKIYEISFEISKYSSELELSKKNKILEKIQKTSKQILDISKSIDQESDYIKLKNLFKKSLNK